MTREGTLRTTTEERAAMCLHRAAMERGAQRALCRDLMFHLLRIRLLASIEPANCDHFSSRASLPAPGKSRLRLTAAWRL